jgi:soluble lytic murein transglycosylase-like protein
MGTTTLAALFLSLSVQYHLPPNLLSAVCLVETKHNPKAVRVQDGGSPSYGLCQVKLATARGLGFDGAIADLLDPKVNATLAAKYLRQQHARYRGNLTKTISAYNAGSWRPNKKGVPPNRKYISKVILSMAGKN